MAKAKTALAAAIRDRLEGQYLSVPKGAEKLGLHYERLKKSLQLNRFSDDDLAVLMPDQSLQDLKRSYEFSTVRAYSRASGSDVPTAREQGGSQDFTIFEEISAAFQWLQKA